MAQEKPRYGNTVRAKVTEVKGTCSWGHSVGQEMEVSCHNTGGMCGFFYHDLFPNLAVLQFGGAFPWGDPDMIQVECPDRYNAVKMELRRVRE